MEKRTKIVATLGPASNTVEVVSRLIKAGANVFRLNFSHGSHESHKIAISTIREASRATGTHVAILGDLCGPKIRVGTFPGGPVTLKAGDRFTLSQDPGKTGDQQGVGTSYPFLVKDVRIGDTVLLDDGNISLKAIEKGENEVHFSITEGGVLKDKKGMNMPGIPLTVETITTKDKDDLRFMIDQGLDFVALSFVRRADDIRLLRQLIGQAGIRTIAKIEKPEAVDEIEDILDEVDAVMIARGDLGVEMPIEQVPAIQKHILNRCSRRGIPAITATQMLESMITNVRPTRAETTDVFNAILDGTDAVMLSGETAAGANPVEAVRVMSAIAGEAEKLLEEKDRVLWREILPEGEKEIEDTIAHAACEGAVNVGARAIVAFTTSGNTALHLSKYHCPVPVYAMTPLESTCRRLALNWGVRSLRVEDCRSTDTMIELSEKILKETGIVKSGQILVIVAGVPLGVKGNTNMIKMHRVS
ncbi:MAG: pyruvate kinase [Candidatus Ozemobacteraceae bacterium]